ncbi:hypothetical protein HPB52_009445 [Rhipicephalus sanguineus]|uniref:Uncharacterized protein n=1 Tax=Rhipicephalus sanguineus TaxID=34632 RepID=A0A9D4SQI9_RHISA|nr:hypothetical protein HPB52_009445 [Rhipicephalus sanguineus]
MVQGPIKSEIDSQSSSLSVSNINSSAMNISVSSMRRLHATRVDITQSRTLKSNHRLFRSEQGISKRNNNHQVDNAVDGGRKVEERDCDLAARVVDGGSMMVTPDLRNYPQTGYVL